MGREAEVSISVYVGGEAQNSGEELNVGDDGARERHLLEWLERWIQEDRKKGERRFSMFNHGGCYELELMFKWISGDLLLHILGLYLEENPSLVLEVTYRDEYETTLRFHKYIGPAVTTNSLFHTLNILYQAQDQVEEALDRGLDRIIGDDKTALRIPEDHNIALISACSQLTNEKSQES